MLKTTIVWNIQQSASTTQMPGGMSGFQWSITVTEVSNITPNIFVLHREVVSAQGPDYADTFYSVASVADLENIPDAPSQACGFYRTNTISLIFRNLEELKEGSQAILLLVGRLIQANDLAINMLSPEQESSPASALYRYWGLSTDASTTDAEIQAFNNEFTTTRPVTKIFNTEGTPSYLYVCYRADLGTGSFTLNSTTVAMTLVTRAFVNTDGHSALYNIYRTTALQNGSTLTLACT